jgi:hypothetical protein
MGRDLLCNLRVQITFDSDCKAPLNLRRPKAKTLILMVAQEKEWWLYASEGRPLELLELPFKISGVWVEDNPPRSSPKCAPSNGRIKARSHPCQPETVLHSSEGP